MDRIYNHNANKILIICKKSIKTQWKEEIKKFTSLGGHFIIEKTESTKPKRMKAYRSISNANQGILITNYQTFLNEQKEFDALKFDFVLIKTLH